MTKIRDRDFCLVLGTRSAIFAPLKNLKLLIVDEEQDSSFRQMESPTITRDCAIKLALENSLALLIFLSATPSLYYRIAKKENKLLHLKQRNDKITKIGFSGIRIPKAPNQCES